MFAQHKERLFTNTFVNEMYAILLAIGIGNVLFNQQIDFGKLSEILGALFVTSVVVLYWWDWRYYIEEHVVESRIEFVIDFGVLIALQMLFVLYRNPTTLVRAFLVLGILDFLWVANHVLQTREKSRTRIIRWILEKALVIVLFAALTFVFIYAGCQLSHLQQIVVLIVTFIIVRLIAFRSLKGPSAPVVRPAKQGDAAVILALNNEAIRIGAKGGFILSELTDTELAAVLANPDHGYIVAESEDGRILGVARIIESAEPRIISDLIWITNSLKNLFLTHQPKYVERIVVSREERRKGCATALYNYARCTSSPGGLYVFISVAPSENTASIGFHKALGFENAGIFRQAHFLGLHDYKSVLMMQLPKAPGGQRY